MDKSFFYNLLMVMLTLKKWRVLTTHHLSIQSKDFNLFLT